MPDAASARSGPGAAVPPRRQRFGYQPALDGIRAFAILGVLLFHAPKWARFPHLAPGGHLGVTIFFVLSGFLITTLLLGELARTDRVDLKRFYLRRAARLMPGLLVLAVFHVAFWTTQVGLIRTIAPVIAALLYLGSIFAAFWHLMGAMTWSWSLSVEEHFYFGWPPLLGGVLGRYGRLHRAVRRRPMLAVAVVALAVIAVAMALRIRYAGSAGWTTIIYFSTFTRMDALAVGCLAALFTWRYRLPLARTLSWVGLALLAFCYLDPALGFGRPALDIWGLPLCGLAAAVLVVGVVQHPRSVLARLLSVRPVVHLGAVSYGLYLWNLLPGSALKAVTGHRLGPVPALLTWLAVLAAVELSYWLVERPVQRWAAARLRGERRWPWVRTEPYGELASTTIPATEAAARVSARVAIWRATPVLR